MAKRVRARRAISAVASKSHPTIANRRSGKVGVFISYSTENESLAKKLKEELLDLDAGKRLEVFIAAELGGRAWRQAIRETLHTAQILLLPYPNKTMKLDWVCYELGMFHSNEVGRAAFERREGVFEIDSGMTHNSAGASYVLTTVRDGTVYFEAYDQIGSEAFKLIESWSVSVGHDPTVSLTAPAEGASFSQGATVSLTADAADTDGSIAQVAFYAGAILIETDTTAPYEASWIPAAPGTYTLTARATDNGNLTAISAPVSVTVNPASSNHPPQLDPIPNRTVDEGTALAAGVATSCISQM